MVRAHESGSSARLAAETYALQRVAEMRAVVQRQTIRRALQKGALRVVNSGLLHPNLLRPLAPRYFALTMGRDPAL